MDLKKECDNIKKHFLLRMANTNRLNGFKERVW